MMSSSASFVVVPFDTDMVMILIIVMTALAADGDIAGAAVDASTDSNPFSESKIWLLRQ